MASDEEERKSSRGSRGHYSPSIVGFLMEYSSQAPLSPWKYSSLIPDTILSYSIPAPQMHYDLVVLRFGRPEKKWEALESALRSMADIAVNKITVFRNRKNSNRLHYLKNSVFPKQAHDYGMRTWDVVRAALDFQGMDNLLEHFMKHDITASPWPKRKAQRLLDKYSLKFSN